MVQRTVPEGTRKGPQVILYILIFLFFYCSMKGIFDRNILDIVAAVIALVMILIQQGVLK